MDDSFLNGHGKSQDSELISRTEEIQIGLKLPDGRIVWPPDEYKGYPLNTTQQRATVLEVLKKTAGDLSFTEEAFIRHYGWATRKLTTTQMVTNIGEMVIDSQEAFADVPEGEGERDAESHYRTTVHERSVGSST